MAEGVGFEPTVELPLRLISSQVPSTAQPPFHCEARDVEGGPAREKIISRPGDRAIRFFNSLAIGGGPE